MAFDEIPEDVRTFLGDHIQSLEQLEVLLLLQRSPQQAWTADAVARELRIDPGSALDRLTDLASRGLLALRDSASQAYSYAPTSPAVERVVTALARTHAERRVTVINLIFSKPVDRVRSFADAFKFKDKK